MEQYIEKPYAYYACIGTITMLNRDYLVLRKKIRPAYMLAGLCF
jgi:hypothetical protein